MSMEKEHIIINDTLRGTRTEVLADYLCHAYCHAGQCRFTFNGNAYLLSAGDCLIVRRADLITDVSADDDLRVDVIYAMPRPAAPAPRSVRRRP